VWSVWRGVYVVCMRVYVICMCVCVFVCRVCGVRCMYDVCGSVYVCIRDM
jgi:hypothetical protein